MVRTLIILQEIWSRRALLLWPVIILSLLFLIVALYQPIVYHGKTTLYLDKNGTASPLLQNITDLENQNLLHNALTRESVVQAALHDAGLLPETSPDASRSALARAYAQRLAIRTPNSNMIQIHYWGEENAQLELFLDALSAHFIYEVLSPERLRTEQQLSSLREQIKFYTGEENEAKKQLAAVRQRAQTEASSRQLIAAEFDLQTALSQKLMAQEAFETLVARSKGLMSMASGAPNTILWAVEAPSVSQQTNREQAMLHALCSGALTGLFISLLLFVLSLVRNRTLRTEEEVLQGLGVKVLGHIPDLGRIRIENGRLTAELKTKL